MKYFFRSLQYLRPYRGRIALAIVCTLFIAMLWGGGLGLATPSVKILLDEAGLHGWAYESLSNDHLQARLLEQDATMLLKPEQLRELFGLQEVGKLINVTVRKEGAADKAGIRDGQWIIGVEGKNLPGREVLKKLAQADPGQHMALTIYSGGKVSQITVEMQKESLGSRVLKYAAVTPGANGQALIPEPKDYSERFNLFVGVLVLSLVLTIVRAILTLIQEYVVGTAIWLGIMDLRVANYNTVLHLPTTFFTEKGVMDATSRFVQDTNELARGQNTLLGKTMVEPAKAIGSLAVALMCSWELTLVALVAGPPAFFFIKKLGKKMHKASKRALEGWSAMLAVLGETLQGIRVVKAYTMEGAERRRFFRVNRALVRQQMRKELLDASTGPTVEFLGVTAGMVAAGFAGYLVFKGFSWKGEMMRLDASVFLGWMMALFAMFDPVRKLAKVWMRFHEADAAAQRIFELRDSLPEAHVANAPSLPPHSQSIEFRNVSYRYPTGHEDAVKNVSLNIRAGQTVAIVGPNGSGKTTLLSLLPRLLEVNAGQIFIDGKDITQVSLRSLRRQIGLVTQDTVLFHATIAENISYGLRRPKQEAVLAAAKQAFVDEFVRDLPNGYDTMVGEFGATLSGGQKQRIAIARAILRDPTILIFDEAMSQVDSDSEHRISQAMETFVKGRTTLLIAHRFATVLSADQIVVMDGGRMVDVGTHKELLERCNLYGHLYKTQFIDSGG